MEGFVIGLVAAVVAGTAGWVAAVLLLGLAAARGLRTADPGRVAVLIPARNEESTIGDAVASASSGLRPTDRVLVVVDNTIDATADRARAAGAEVLERHVPGERGKGFALDAGLRHLAADPPDVVVIFDADGRFVAGDARSLASAATRRAAQAEYLIDGSDDPRLALSSLAVVLRNRVRARGLDAAGIPVPVQGNGVAIPWAATAAARGLGAEAVEDVVLGARLARLGAGARLHPGVQVRAAAPPDRAAATVQRRRWEGGGRTTRREAWALIRTGRPACVAMGIDLAIPPLVRVLVAVAVVVPLAAAAGEGRAASILAVAAGALVAAAALAWAAHGRTVAPPSTMLAVPGYVLWKLRLALGLVLRRDRGWQRTPRSAGVREILGVAVHPWSQAEAIADVRRRIAADEPGRYAFLNAFAALLATRDPAYRQVLASLTVLPDGLGVDLASWWHHGETFPANLNGTDFVPALLAALPEGSVALLGARPGVAERAMASLHRRFGHLRFRVVHHGYGGDEALPGILADLEADRPDVLLVALGNPQQERWIAEHATAARCGVALGVGGLFDFEAGDVRRAPPWVRRLRSEWLWRLLQEPRRLGARYVVGIPAFLIEVVGRRAVGNTVAALAATAMTLVAAEVAVRVVRPVDWRAPASPADASLVHQASAVPGLAYELRPGAEGTWKDTAVVINEHGRRDEPGPLPPGPRIAAVGDSFTFGYGVQEPDAWPAQLEQRLRRGDPGSAVPNLGVGGYSTRDEAAVVRHRALPLEPAAIVVGYVLNDPQIEPVQPLQAAFAPTRWWQHSHLARAWVRARRGAAIARHGDRFVWLHRDPERWGSVQDAFAEMGRSDVPVIVAIFPHALTPWAEYPYAELHAQVATAARDAGLVAVDLLPTWRAHDPGTLTVSATDPHPSPAGHALAAERIHAELSRLGIVAR